MNLAILCSAHGFGHLTRQIAIAQVLEELGARVTFFTNAPPLVVTQTLPHASIVPWVIDVGIAQQDSLSEDIPLTLERLQVRCGDQAIDALAGKLGFFDAAIVDVAPAGLEAARRANIPALAIGNFDWAWIYQHYSELQKWAAKFALWQAPHPAIALSPGPGMHGFSTVTQFGRVCRSGRPFPLPEKTVLVSFGGMGLRDLRNALPKIPGVTWVMAPPMPNLNRPDCLYVPDVPYPSLVGGASVVLTKPGYGILAEAVSQGTPLVWVPRGKFPESPWLISEMNARGDRPLMTGIGDSSALATALDTLWSQPKPIPKNNDATVVARWINQWVQSQPRPRVERH